MKLEYTPDLIITERVGEIERTYIWKHFSHYVQSKSLKEQAINEYTEKQREHRNDMFRQVSNQNQTSEGE